MSGRPLLLWKLPDFRIPLPVIVSFVAPTNIRAADNTFSIVAVFRNDFPDDLSNFHVADGVIDGDSASSDNGTPGTAESDPGDTPIPSESGPPPLIGHIKITRTLSIRPTQDGRDETNRYFPLSLMISNMPSFK